MTLITEKILKEIEELPLEMQKETLDFVEFLKNKQMKEQSDIINKDDLNGKKISEIMDRIAYRGTAFSDIKDPVEWQKENSDDRLLPGREK